MPVPVVVVFWNILSQPMSLYHPSVLLEDKLDGGQDRKTEGAENQPQDGFSRTSAVAAIRLVSFARGARWASRIRFSNTKIACTVKLPFLDKERLNNGQQKRRQRSYRRKINKSTMRAHPLATMEKRRRRKKANGRQTEAKEGAADAISPNQAQTNRATEICC
jgi:hypothetical protein